ncbi:MAG TPA: glycosyltransferase family 87 protein [Solirubrobacteraceae bacterium]
MRRRIRSTPAPDARHPADAGAPPLARLRWLGGSAATVLLLGSLLLSGPGLLISTVNRVGYNLLYDFRGGLYNAGVAILHGRTPYRPGFLAHQAALLHAGHLAIGETATHSFSIPVYPALANVLVVPFSALPFWVAGLIYTLLSAAAMVVGIRLLGVRDRRCLALVVISWPFLFGAFLGAIGPFLVLGAGAAWRWRDRIGPPALALATIIAVKIFPWTLAVWLLITRRYRALAACTAAGILLTFGAWALIGFDGLARYPQMLSNMSFIQEDRSVSIVGVLVIAGVSSTVATAVAMLLGAGILILAWRLRHGPDGDRRAFGLAVLAALTATPIVWEHYMVLLFIPIALASPRFSAAWLIPLCTPIIEAASWIIPASRLDAPFSPNLLRSAGPWLFLELLTGVVLCTTPVQRRSVWLRLRRLPGSLAAGPEGAAEPA